MALNAVRLTVVLVLSLVPLLAEAQQKVHRIGFLRSGAPPATFTDGLRQGLGELGYVEGRNFRIEFALAESADQLPDAAADLVRRGVDVIIASGTPPTEAAMEATQTIPIVFVASFDPVAQRVVASLARPGGNVTGFAGMHADLMGKRLELLKEVVPGLSRVAALAHTTNLGTLEYIRQAQLAAPALGLDLQVVTVHDTDELESAFAEARGAGAVILLDDVFFTAHRERAIAVAARHRLPVVYPYREFADTGGLMTYGPNLRDQYRRAAAYVDKILKGAKPADLPIELPVTLELIINLKTARALGLTIPPAVLARSDALIE